MYIYIYIYLCVCVCVCVYVNIITPPFNPFPVGRAPINGSVRSAGAMEPLYWSPCSDIFELTEEDIRKLPQRVVWFGCDK